MKPMNSIALLGVLFTLCSCTAVQPWERGTLAKQEMAADPLPVKSALDRHIYFSKEGASGGGRAAGGGCGCN